MTPNESAISTIDLIILGFLYRESHSAYEIQKMIEYRNLSNWVKISTPSVYKKVLAMEKKGYLTRRSDRAGNMPEKTVYTISDGGREYFGNLMKGVASAKIPVLFDFNAVIANLALLPKKESKALLANIKEGIARERAYVAEHILLRSGIPIEGRSILEQQLCVYDALMEWMDKYERLLGSGKTE